MFASHLEEQQKHNTTEKLRKISIFKPCWTNFPHQAARVVRDLDWVGQWRWGVDGWDSGMPYCPCCYDLLLRGFCYVHPYLGKIPIFTNIFQKGLKPPTSLYLEN